MSVPRITLWTESFKMPLHISLRSFDEVSLDKQVIDIQRSNLVPLLYSEEIRNILHQIRADAHKVIAI
jgi:hypothetical protein